MKPFQILLWFLLSSFVGIFVWYGDTLVGRQVSIRPESDVPTVPARTADQELLGKIQKLSLEKRVGQLMIFGFASTTPDEHIQRLIAEYGVSGVNLLKRNVVNAEQVKGLTEKLQAFTDAEGLPPMLIGVDQEGEVNRFTFLEEHTSQKDVANPIQAHEIAKRRGKELASLGINMNFSPVLDYVPDSQAYLYARTFATTTKVAAVLGIAMVSGYEQGGVIPVAKHFPGYGRITVDPHKKQAKLTQDMLEDSLSVFKRVLEARPDIPVMTAHIVYPEFDAYPATRSKKFLTELLRESWEYDGVIITDDLEMAGAGEGDFREVALESLEAGSDMLISTYTTSRHEPIISAVVAAVNSGRLSEERINESVLRVWKLKAKIREKSDTGNALE